MMIPGSLLLVALLVASAPGIPSVPYGCAVTLPEAGTFVPPAPYDPELSSPHRFWYGSERLWALPAADGIWRGNRRDHGVFNKVFWWSSAWEWKTDHRPALTVTARRLDADVQPVAATPATNAHESHIHHAMLVGLAIPTSGCWEITGEYKGETLSYVVWAPPSEWN
jgi:hypothetical protein